MNLSKKSKVIIVLLIFGAIIAYAVFQYSMQPPAKIESKKVDFTGTSIEFLAQITTDFSAWQDKVVVITGDITTSDPSGITLNNQIYCQFREDVDKTTIKENQKITLKGRVIGYDDLLEEVKLDQCIIQL
jgi:uncharacterized protein YdeI (BOF family)